MPKVKDYDPNTYDDDDLENEYEQNKLKKMNRKLGLEGFGNGGGNKSRNKRNKKETHRIVEEKE